MKVLITGATGFIGRYLVPFFLKQGYSVVALSRLPQKARQLFPAEVTCLRWINKDPQDWLHLLHEPVIIINLIGENIAGRYWTKKYKRQLVESRLNATATILMAIQQLKKDVPHIWIQASAVGYYGNTQQVVDESAPAGKDFLADLVVNWEKGSEGASLYGVRRAVARLGVVLGPNGGALQKMLLPFKLFLGGPLGSGQQGFPWIHINDVARAMLFLIEHSEQSGVFNFVAPQTVTQKEFCRTLAKVLKRPCWLPAPAPVLKLLLGEMARVALLKGQFVQPKRLLQAGFSFQFPKLQPALEEILTQANKGS